MRRALEASRGTAAFVACNAVVQWLLLWRHGAELAAREGGAGAAQLAYYGLYTGALCACVGWVLLGFVWGESGLRGGARAKVTPWMVAVAEWLLFVAVVIDSKVFATMGVHVYQPAVIDALLGEGVEHDVQLGRGTMWSAAAFVTAAACAQAALLALCRRQRRWLSPGHARGLYGGLVSLTLIAMTLTWSERPETTSGTLIGGALPLYETLVAPVVPRYEAVDVRYPGAGAPTALRLEDPPDILWIQVESLRADHTNERMTPQMVSFGRTRCLTSERHYAGAQTTERGTFSLLYGVDAYYYGAFERERAASYPLSLLKASGYRLIGASASSLKRFRGAGFMLEIFGTYVEYLRGREGEDDRALVEFARQALQTRGPDPRLVFLFLNSTHHNYEYPSEFERFRPVLPIDYDHMGGDTAAPAEQMRIQNRYRNSVGYVDALFGELMEGLSERIERGELIVMLTGDHGEEFWEHGLLGHSAPRFIEERGRVPLLLCLPGVDARTVELSSHVDVWPTVLAHLSPGEAPEAEQYGHGESLLEPGAGSSPRLLFINGLDFPHENPTACLLDGERKYWLELCAEGDFCLQLSRLSTMDDEVLDSADEDGRLQRYLRALRARRARFARWITQ